MAMSIQINALADMFDFTSMDRDAGLSRYLSSAHL